MPAHPPTGEPTVASESGLAARQCGRCREFFDGDPALNPTAIPEWWACPACREIMFGDRSGRSTTAQVQE